MEFGRSSSCTQVRNLRSFTFLAALVAVLLAPGCASRPDLNPKTGDAKTPPTVPSEKDAADDRDAKADELTEKEQIQKLREKIVDLETRIDALNEKINIENGAAPGSGSSPVIPGRKSDRPTAEANESLDKELPIVDVKIPAASAKVVPTSKTPVKFAQDENIDRYREAKIMYDSNRYTDSTVEFVSFVKEAPDHALAPAAQYYVGMGYVKQKEYSRAEEELSRGLVSYPHSNYVPDTLLALLDVSVALKKPARVTYYRQKLIGTFPNSPQALQASLSTAKLDSKIEAEPREEKSPVARPETPTAPVAPSAPKASGNEAEST
ncbi:MAG: hypothetical protein JST80_04065 [Bdellovibrionales bacterium]|nr:hypothetical protein [Bdellovibrionales bacterium]